MKAKSMEEVYGNTRAWMEQIYREARFKLEREAAEVAAQYALPELKTRVKEDLDQLQANVRQDLDRMMGVHPEQKPERHHANVQRQINGAAPSFKRHLSGAEMMLEIGLGSDGVDSHHEGRLAKRKRHHATGSATAVNRPLAANNVSRRRPRLSQLPAIILTVAHEQTPLGNHSPSHRHKPPHSQLPTHSQRTSQSLQSRHASLDANTQSVKSAGKATAAEIQPEGGCSKWPLGPGQAWSGPMKGSSCDRGQVPGHRMVIPAGEVRYLTQHFPSVGESIHPGFVVMQPGCDECTRRNKICTFGVGTNHKGRIRDPSKGNCDLCITRYTKCRGLGFTGIAPSTRRFSGQTSKLSDHAQHTRRT